MKPMLANTLTPDNVRFPCFVQPKLNGIRCFWDGQTAWTRGGKHHKPHVHRLLAALPAIDGLYDGELVCRTGDLLETVQSAVMGEGETSKLHFRIFDVATPEPLRFRDRLDMIHGVAIETTLVRTPATLESMMDRFIEEGYEGLIARNPNGSYQEARTNDLLKYKRWHDAEFPITDVVEASGKDAGTAVFVCSVANGKLFGVVPAGTREDRQAIWLNRQKWVGRFYTVKFHCVTSHGMPRDPIGVGDRYAGL